MDLQPVWMVLRRSAIMTWDFLRLASGDDAYERYVAHARCTHPGATPMSRHAFELDRQQRKWNRVSRCC